MACPICNDTGFKKIQVDGVLQASRCDCFLRQRAEQLDHETPATDQCPACNGSGWSRATIDGAERLTRCACWREKASGRALSESRIPPRYRNCDLNSLITYQNEKFLRAVQKARRFAEEFPVVDKGLMLIGPPGIGKTHLAVATLRQVSAKLAVRGLYCDTRELLREIRSTYNPALNTAEMDVLRPVMEAELLILDDIGVERLSDWVEETMNLIVNTRYNERRLTIFTSNFDDVPDPTDLDSLLVRVGYRMHSRLREMCTFLEWEGPDFRDLSSNERNSEDLHKLWKQKPRTRLPQKTTGQMRAQLRKTIPMGGDGKADLKWPGGRAGS